MEKQELYRYIAGLPVGPVDWAAEAEAKPIEAVDLVKLPDGIVTGSNLLQFSGETEPVIRSAVALSLLAAQRVAANDTVITTPGQWIKRHNTVLMNLNWLVEKSDKIDAKFEDFDVAVHEAIIPFLTLALGPAATAASIIITALKQLKEMDQNAPWIVVFDRESRRFNVSEYQFSYVDTKGDKTVLHMAAARLDAKYGLTQALFVKVSRKKAKFEGASSTMRADTSLLEEMNDGLKHKLGLQASVYIRSLQT